MGILPMPLSQSTGGPPGVDSPKVNPRMVGFYAAGWLSPTTIMLYRACCPWPLRNSQVLAKECGAGALACVAAKRRISSREIPCYKVSVPARRNLPHSKYTERGRARLLPSLDPARESVVRAQTWLGRSLALPFEWNSELVVPGPLTPAASNAAPTSPPVIRASPSGHCQSA